MGYNGVELFNDNRNYFDGSDFLSLFFVLFEGLVGIMCAIVEKI